MMKAFALFHLNLAFSSIAEEQRATVVAQCYHPLLDLARHHGAIAIEASGYTLEAIARCDGDWLTRLKALIASGKVEFIGSGYSQMIGPLVPAKMVAANLRLGHDVYARLLGIHPHIALVNEQAWSGGLVHAYRDAEYDAVLLDWDNVANAHPDWDSDYRYTPQRALGTDDRDIALLWTNTVAFQKLQRLAHDDITLADYLTFVAEQRRDGRLLCLYASDAEVFGFRPGRYATEVTHHGPAEWARITQAFDAVTAMDGVTWVRPSDALATMPPGQCLRLETPAYPIPVKKQRKYNITRWAVSGRDDMGINAACQRIFASLEKTGSDDDWRALCRLWASDFRTHITPARWDQLCTDLKAMEARLGTTPPASLPAPQGTVVEDRYIDIETPTIKARLDRRRGLAITRAAFAPVFKPLIGGIPHGTFDDIALQADWYTGNCVFEAPGEHKVTDLEWAKTHLSHQNTVTVQSVVATQLGPIIKRMTFHADTARIDCDLEFQWPSWPRGVLRLGHITLLPNAFDAQSLYYTTCNGGGPERFDLTGQTVAHGDPVSFLVSAQCALGMTDGWLEIGDAHNCIRITVNRQIAPLVGMITHRRVAGGLFCQLMLSAQENDDTARPAPYNDGPRHFRYSITRA